jgi:hypothetical protein
MKTRSLLILSALLLLIEAHAFAFYDPGTGRWLSKDPIGEEGGLNLYGFVFNRPTRMVDQDGRKPIYDDPNNPELDEPLSPPGYYLLGKSYHYKVPEPNPDSLSENNLCPNGTLGILTEDLPAGMLSLLLYGTPEKGGDGQTKIKLGCCCGKLVSAAVQLSGNRNVLLNHLGIDINEGTLGALSVFPTHSMLEFSPPLTLQGPGVNGNVSRIRFTKEGYFMDSNAKLALTELLNGKVRNELADRMRANKQIQMFMKSAPSILESIDSFFKSPCSATAPPNQWRQ